MVISDHKSPSSSNNFPSLILRQALIDSGVNERSSIFRSACLLQDAPRRKGPRILGPLEASSRTVGGSAGSEDLVCCVEDALRGALSDRLAFAPFLDVAPAVLHAGKAQRLAAQESDRLGFDFADVAWRDLGFGEILLLTTLVQNKF